MKTNLIARPPRAWSSAIASPIKCIAGAMLLAVLVTACGGAGSGSAAGAGSAAAGASSPSGASTATPASTPVVLHCAP